MDVSKRQVIEATCRRVEENLKKNNMEACYLPSVSAVPEQVASWLHERDTVAVGGSMTLAESGVMSLLKSGKYRFLDRYAPGLTPEETRRIFIESFAADAYLCSANAITLNGELYNVDGNSNRVAAICYGPASVIVVAGYNKIVKDLDEAVQRVKRMAAPANAVRLGCETPCASLGSCAGLNGGMTAGCNGDSRICCNYLVSARQREKGRIKVILVGRELGY